jgi:hypothetical protein
VVRGLSVRLQQLYANRADIKKLRRAISDLIGFRQMQFCEGPRGTAPGRRLEIYTSEHV